MRARKITTPPARAYPEPKEPIDLSLPPALLGRVMEHLGTTSRRSSASKKSSITLCLPTRVLDRLNESLEGTTSSRSGYITGLVRADLDRVLAPLGGTITRSAYLVGLITADLDRQDAPARASNG